MNRRILAVCVALLAALIPASTILADTLPEDCADGEWEVRPDQTLGLIAILCDTTVDALVSYNNIENPNLIFTDQIILIPPADFTPGDAPADVPADDAADTPAEEPATEPEEDTATPPPPPVGEGAAAATFGTIVYDDFNSFAQVPITVTNFAVEQGVAGGRFLPPEEGEGPQWVTLIGAVHTNPPYPEVTNEPLWKATVYFSDGTSNLAYAGCIYREEVFAEGDEAISRDDNIWFHWEITLPGGWFDCGNTLGELRSPPDLYPGESGTAILQIYLEHPRLWDADGPVQDKRVTRIDLEVFDVFGQSLGVIASESFQ